MHRFYMKWGKRTTVSGGRLVRIVARQIAQPFILPVMYEDPGDFSNLVDAGTGEHKHRRPMKDEGPEHTERDRKPPHRSGEGIHIENRIAARGEDSVDDDRIDAAADHIDRRYDHKSGQVALGLLGELHDRAGRENRKQNEQRT